MQLIVLAVLRKPQQTKQVNDHVFPGLKRWIFHIYHWRRIVLHDERIEILVNDNVQTEQFKASPRTSQIQTGPLNERVGRSNQECMSYCLFNALVQGGALCLRQEEIKL